MTPARTRRRQATSHGAGWLVFVHQLPARPSNARVKTWRRLQQMGAVAMRNGVYLLADTVEAREDFEWLRSEVADLGGDASIFEVSAIKGLDERALRAQVRRNRPAEATGPAAPSPGGRRTPARDYQNRRWVTRPRPGVDRFSSAWLIRRFIDPAAEFLFATAPQKAPDAVPFDMYQSGGFRHEGERCTFEVLQQRFTIKDPAVSRIAEIVHDLDLKDERFKSPHAPTVAHLVEGLRAAYPDDAELLAQGITVFEALYLSFQPNTHPRGGKARIC